MKQYQDWSCDIWQALALNAIRSGEYHQHQAYYQAKCPKKAAWDGIELYHPQPAALKQNGYVKQLHWAKWHHINGEISPSLHTLLTALWDSEFMGHFRYYRIAVILLADLGLDMGLESKSMSILEEIMPQVINGDDLEQRAYACFTLARTKIMLGKGVDSALNAALVYLGIAEEDYIKLAIPSALVHVQAFISAIYNRQGNTEQRNAAADRHNKTLELLEGRRGKWNELNEEMKGIWQLVEDIGGVIASKHRDGCCA